MMMLMMIMMMMALIMIAIMEEFVTEYNDNDEFLKFCID